jgi:hypothetical protein
MTSRSALAKSETHAVQGSNAGKPIATIFRKFRVRRIRRFEFGQGKQLKVILLRISAAVFLLALLIYAGDYLSIRYKLPKGRDQFSTVTIQPYYAIHEKNGRTEYDFAQPETQVCIHSLFPHFGYSPCWYVNRHTDKRIDI